MSPMLARVADNLYWIARAIERADTYARLLEVSHAMTRESGDVSYGARTVWEPLVEITGDMERFEQLFHVADEESVVQFLATSPDNPNSITSCLRRARQNAQSVRDLLPTDVWEALNTVYLELAEAETGTDDRERVYLLSRQVRRAVALLHGLIDGGMRRDGSWYFLRLGRFTERAEKSARLLEVKYRLLLPDDAALIGGVELHQWRSLLRSAGADEASRRLDVDLASPRRLAQLLVTNDRFPRSVVYCLDQVAMALTSLVAGGDIAEADTALTLVGQTRAALIAAESLPSQSLAERMDRVQRQCNAIDEAVALSCFAYSPGAGMEGTQRAQAARQAQN